MKTEYFDLLTVFNPPTKKIRTAQRGLIEWEEYLLAEKGRIERKPHGMAVEIVRPPQVKHLLTNKEKALPRTHLALAYKHLPNDFNRIS